MRVSLSYAHYSFAFGLTRLHPHLVGDGKDTHPSERGHTIHRQLCSIFFPCEKHAHYL